MLWAAAVTAPFKPILAGNGNVGHNHSQHLFMNIDSRYPVRHKSSSRQEREACCDFLNQGHGLAPLHRKGKHHCPIIRSTTHAPDQTDRRPQLLHCAFNLTRSQPSSILPLPRAAVFMSFRGPQAHTDRQECLCHTVETNPETVLTF